MWRVRAERRLIRSNNTHGSVINSSQLLAGSVQELAIARFFHDFVIPLDDPASEDGTHPHGSYFAFVPSLYRRAGVGSSFSLALSAAANANFWRRCKSHQARSQSLKDYGKALSVLNQDLHHAEQQVTFETLAATCLLGMHELVVSRNAQEKSSWRTHANGAAALLKIKHDGDHHVHETAGLLQTILITMTIDRMIAGTKPTIPLQVCLSLMPPESTSATLLEYMYRVAEICANLNQSRESSEKIVQDVSKFLVESSALEKEMVDWIEAYPKGRDITLRANCPQNIPIWLRPLYSSPGAPTMLHQYADIHITHQLQFFRASRLTLLAATLSAVNILLAASDSASVHEIYVPLEVHLQARIIEVVDEVLQGAFSSLMVKIPGKAEAQSLADVLGVRGYQLLWPLRQSVASLNQLDQERSDVSSRLGWIRRLFCCLKDDLGVQRPQDSFQSS